MDKTLTPLELKVMHLLWEHKQAFVKELVEAWEGEPVPAYNTISTMVRILEEKGFVGHEAFGRTHRYFPLISKAMYQRQHLRSVVENVFDGSFKGLLAGLLGGGEISPGELAEVKRMLDEHEQRTPSAPPGA